MMISCSRGDTTLPETNSSHLNMDGWSYDRFLFGAPHYFQGLLLLVSGRFYMEE